MKRLIDLVCIALVMMFPLQASAGGFDALLRETKTYAKPVTSRPESRLLNRQLLEMYLWSKDNFELKQWPEVWQQLEPLQSQYQTQPVRTLSNQSIQAAYGLLAHDYEQARMLTRSFKSDPAWPYAEMLTLLLGEQVPGQPGIWRISLPASQNLVQRQGEQALSHVILAEALLERQQWPDVSVEDLQAAQKAVLRALALQSDLDYARYQQGQIYYFQGQTAQAQAYFEKHVAQIDAVAAEAVGNFYVWMQDLDLAVSFYELARKQSPQTLRLYHKLEQVYLHTQPEQLVRLYLSGLAAQPEQTVFYASLRTHYAQAETEQILAWAQEMLSHQPALRGLIQGDLTADPKQAQLEYESVLQHAPRQEAAYLNLLELFWEQGELADMTRLLQQAEQLGLGSAGLQYWQGVLALQVQKFNEAEQYLKPLAETDLRARYTLAMVYRQQGNYRLTQALLLSLLEQEPQNLAFLLALGDVLLEQNNVTEATKVYRIAQQVNPHDAMVYFSLSNLLTRQEKYVEAAQLLERAILIAPEALALRNNLGNVYIRQQRLERAREVFQGILNAQPDYAVAYYNLACIDALSERWEQAYQNLEQAFKLDAALKKTAREDQDLNALRSESRFQDLLREW